MGILSLFTQLLVIPESYAVIYSVEGKEERNEVDDIWTDLWRGENRMEEEVNRRVAGRFKGVCMCWCRSWLSERNRVKLGRKRDCETLSGCWPLLQPAWRADLAWPHCPPEPTVSPHDHTHTQEHTLTHLMHSHRCRPTRNLGPQGNTFKIIDG